MTIKKRILSFFTCFVFLVLFIYSPLTAYAASVEWLQPVSGFDKGQYVTNAQYNTALTSLQTLFDRNNINYNSYYIIISDISVSTGRHIVMFPKGNENLSNYNFESTYSAMTYNVYTGDNIYTISDDFSGIALYPNNNYSTKYGLCKNEFGYYACTFSNKNIINVFTSDSFIYFTTLNLSLAPEDEEPIYGPLPMVVNLPFYSLDVDNFYDWLVNTDKINQLPSYITAQKLKSFLTFYKNFGSSNRTFSEKIKEWFTYMNIGGQTQDNIDVLKRSIDSLYQEYLQYINGTHAYWPTATKIQERQRIDTNTTDNNTVLITDDSNDTLDISILRDILRGVIAISNNVNEGVGQILGALARLDFVVNVTNNGGSTPAPTSDNNIDYTDQGDFGIDEIHQYEPLPEAPDIDGDIDFLDYPAVLAQSTNAFFNLLPSDMSALMSAVLVLGVLITKIGR